jgi:hypothetical protein
MSQPDLDTLLNDLIPFAQRMLGEYGEFLPFGAWMALDGSITSVGADSGNEHPKSQEIISLLVDGFRQQVVNGQIKAVGICFDVRVVPPGQSEKTDAIQVNLEHMSGIAVEIFLPYEVGKSGEVVYGDLFACQGTQQIFI